MSDKLWEIVILSVLNLNNNNDRINLLTKHFEFTNSIITKLVSSKLNKSAPSTFSGCGTSCKMQLFNLLARVFLFEASACCTLTLYIFTRSIYSCCCRLCESRAATSMTLLGKQHYIVLHISCINIVLT